MKRIIYDGIVKDFYEYKNFDKFITNFLGIFIPLTEISKNRTIAIYHNEKQMITLFYESVFDIVEEKPLVKITLFGNNLKNLEEKLTSFKL